MAKATTVIHRIPVSEEEQRRRDLLEIEQLLADNKKLIKEFFNMLENIQKRGGITLVSSLFGQGDKVLDVLVKAADKPETANTIKNLLLMLGTLGTLNVQQLEPIILKVNNGIARVAETHKQEETATYGSLIRSLADPEVKQAMYFLVSFLKGMGEDRKELERNTQMPENQAPVLYQNAGSVNIKSSRKTATPRRWLLAASGLSLISLAWLASKEDR